MSRPSIDGVKTTQIAARICAIVARSGLFDRFSSTRSPDRKGAPLGPDQGSLQEREALE